MNTNDHTISGSFEISGTPTTPNAAAESLGAMRMTFHKQFHGDMEGTSTVEMLGIMDKPLQSGAYVAIERFIGKLRGRNGSFCLHHSSTMTRGKSTQRIEVVPDSATGELKGLAGSMSISISEGKHSFTFTYGFNEAAS